LFFGVGFGFSLVSFWVCLRLVSRAFICFIWSVEPFRMRLDNLFIYPLTELLEIRWTNQHCSFSLCCHIAFFREESFHASHAPRSHHFLGNSLTTCFCWCLTLGRTKEYNHTTKVFKPMTWTFLSEDTIIALRQLHPLPLNPVLPFIFYY
jgi:hypothetical protein